MMARADRLILSLMNGNPGALVEIAKVLRHPLRHALLRHLQTEGLVGCALWCVVKDEYCRDALRFSSDQIISMTGHKHESLCGIRP